MTEIEYGLASPADVAGMTGKQILQTMIDRRIPAPPISKALSFILAEVGDGFAAFEGDTGFHLLNPAGVVHGGWALTLIDSACGCAAQTLLPAGVAYTTVETKVNFTRAITKDTGRVRCEASVIAQGRKIITAESKLKSADGKVLAHGTSTLMVLNGAG
jgi:uncharacterized protein (TIGR00369 family)